MNVAVHIDGVQEANVGAGLLDRLIAIYPEGGRYPGSFTLTLAEGDARTLAVIEELNRFGLRPWTNHDRPRDLRREYRIDYRREYDASDYEMCDYLRMLPVEEIDTAGRDDDGRIVFLISHRGLPTQCSFAAAGLGCWYVVPDSTRRLIEAEHLLHVVFRPTALLDERIWPRVPLSWDQHGPPWWEISSDLILSAVSPSMEIRDRKGDPVSPGFDGMVSLRDPIDPRVCMPELHYRREDIKGIDAFDLALTFERPGRPDERWMIASQRVRRFFLENAIAMNWIPVRIDE